MLRCRGVLDPCTLDILSCGPKLAIYSVLLLSLFSVIQSAASSFNSKYQLNELSDPKQTASGGDGRVHFMATVWLPGPSQRPVCETVQTIQGLIHKSYGLQASNGFVLPAGRGCEGSKMQLLFRKESEQLCLLMISATALMETQT